MAINRERQAAIVIPVYKSIPTSHERIALNRCLEILGDHAILLMAPENMDLTHYLKFNSGIAVYTFEPRHFQSIQAYDRLMLSKQFYSRFLAYEFILIYQLDAFVFEDQLNEWCAKRIDYVGAPWIDIPAIDYIASTATRLRRQFPVLRNRLNNKVGNGGFSLRRVKSFLRILSIWQGKAQNWPYYEDTFWSFFATSYDPFFKIPEFDEALKFAFEHSPAKCFEMNERRLPFGCHGWEKYEIEFWRPIFREHGYEI